MKLQRPIFCNGIFFCFFLSPMLPCRVRDNGSHESRAERDETRREREREKEFVSGNGVVAAAAATAGGSMYATVFLFLYAIVFSFVLYASFLLSFANTRRFFLFFPG